MRTAFYIFLFISNGFSLWNIATKNWRVAVFQQDMALIWAALIVISLQKELREKSSFGRGDDDDNR